MGKPAGRYRPSIQMKTDRMGVGRSQLSGAGFRGNRAAGFAAVWVLVLVFTCRIPAKTECAAPVPSFDRIRIACVGDSITYGLTLEDRETDCYPAHLQRLLGSRYEVGQFGRRGARVSTGSSRCYTNFPEYAYSLSFSPDVVIISLGINDCSVGAWADHKKNFVASYTKLIDSYRRLESRPKIWLTTLMPIMPPYEPYLAIQQNIRECQGIIEFIAEQEDLAVIDLFTELNRQHRIYAEDGIHPSREGAALIAKKVYASITGDFGGLCLPYVFDDHMVLQREMPIRVFGTGNVGDRVEVKLAEQGSRTIVDGNGNWRVELPALHAGGPYTLIVTADRTIEFHDVMVGEVWFCAGQSNMAMPLKSDQEALTLIAMADQYPQIRLLKRTVDPEPGKRAFAEEELRKINLDGYYSGCWETGSNQSAKDFSAVGYCFALELAQTLGVPIGIIQNAIGGAPIEAFLPREAFQQEPLYRLTADWLDADSPSWHRDRAKLNLGNRTGRDPRLLPHHPYEPTFLFYSDIEEMIPYGIRGVLWYQGESNATDVETDTAWDLQINKALFKNLICSWRSKWSLGDFPFYYVQLPNMNRNWMLFRQMQFEVLRELPALGMAVTIDIGEENNVHPKSKYEVGRRLSLWARTNVYGQTDLVYSGPIFNRDIKKEGDKIYFRFDSVGSGLTTSDGDELKGFEVQDSKGVWHSADAFIHENYVAIKGDWKKCITAVRYAWHPNPCANLSNQEGLPASPFYAELIKK